MTRRTVGFSPEAISDINEVFDYLVPLAGSETARRYVTELYDHCLGFNLFAERGVARNDLMPGLRVVGFRRRASIAFLVADDHFLILRIFHRGRDVRLP